uniref:DNA (cytosine-5-)-methyltransferase n=1 Tax=viral metagenome TaxID=1070528 RepID=A0A6C0L521_9ZZZZ|tara:strand:+ start:6230 stop:7156 length:927 start_codon:yes stop_codon:yes gene_type:complete
MLKIGTDCSGIEAPIQAIQKIGKKYGIEYEHVFSSENNQYAIDCLNENYSPEILYGDIQKRNVKGIPDIDIYVSGFPCQPFSKANKFKTKVDPRLNLFENCLDVIVEKNPKIFILENVKTLVSLNNGSYFDEILSRLENIGKYDIQWKVMNSKDYGIPQSRDRLYIIGILSSSQGQDFVFPPKKKMKDIHKFIDKRDLPKMKIKESNKKLFQNIPKDSVFIDIGFRNSKFINSNKWAPCITAQPNMWCVPKQRKATVQEYLSLQGFPKTFQQPDNISDHQMKIRIGNSMTVDVIEALLISCLRSIQMI